MVAIAENFTMDLLSVAYTAGAPRERLEFIYDSQGRRVQKTHLVWDEIETVFAEKSRDLFLYDGWTERGSAEMVLISVRKSVPEGWRMRVPSGQRRHNLLAELRAVDGAADPAMHRRYAWGMDLSGSLQGAGGVGGLLMVVLADETVLYPAYDGNGNVMGLFDPGEDDWAAEFEYGAFGEPLRATGPLADANPFRFSTKYTDAETELVYYGFRYYVPETGRWLNRDPIGEEGGLNLYGFVGNDGVNGWDYLGLQMYEYAGVMFRLIGSDVGSMNQALVKIAESGEGASLLSDIKSAFDAINAPAPDKVTYGYIRLENLIDFRNRNPKGYQSYTDANDKYNKLRDVMNKDHIFIVDNHAVGIDSIGLYYIPKGPLSPEREGIVFSTKAVLEYQYSSNREGTMWCDFTIDGALFHELVHYLDYLSSYEWRRETFVAYVNNNESALEARAMDRTNLYRKEKKRGLRYHSGGTGNLNRKRPTDD